MYCILMTDYYGLDKTNFSWVEIVTFMQEIWYCLLSHGVEEWDTRLCSNCICNVLFVVFNIKTTWFIEYYWLEMLVRIIKYFLLELPHLLLQYLGIIKELQFLRACDIVLYLLNYTIFRTAFGFYLFKWTPFSHPVWHKLSWNLF